jgi:5'-methylthioadenosine phosphorylase
MATRSKIDADIGVIGGSGLYEMDGLHEVRELVVATPFGKPSDALVLGTLDTDRTGGEGVRVAFLSRHGRGHRLSPSEINYRANIYALKSVGVGRVISVSAVGSMKEHMRPGDVVLPNQFIDLTKRRSSTFFDQGVAAHVAFSDPVCARLAAALHKATQEAGATVHAQGTYLCIEGPQFSTRAESMLYRQWGVDVIGMTNLPEAKLAREAELCYATMALVTDYDCWHEHEAAVTVEGILETLRKNIALAKRVLRTALTVAAEPRTCVCRRALESALVTAPSRIPASARKRLALLIGKYLKKTNQ